MRRGWICAQKIRANKKKRGNKKKICVHRNQNDSEVVALAKLLAHPRGLRESFERASRELPSRDSFEKKACDPTRLRAFVRERSILYEASYGPLLTVFNATMYRLTNSANA